MHYNAIPGNSVCLLLSPPNHPPCESMFVINRQEQWHHHQHHRLEDYFRRLNLFIVLAGTYSVQFRTTASHIHCFVQTDKQAAFAR